MLVVISQVKMIIIPVYVNILRRFTCGLIYESIYQALIACVTFKGVVSVHLKIAYFYDVKFFPLAS